VGLFFSAPTRCHVEPIEGKKYTNNPRIVDNLKVDAVQEKLSHFFRFGTLRPVMYEMIIVWCRIREMFFVAETIGSY
jgi:hypothetical protein